jgi:hypothetical protein
VLLTLNVATYELLITMAGWIDAFKFVEGKEERSTGLEKPRMGLIVMVDVRDTPALTVIDAGLAERLKSGPTTIIET